MPAGARCWGGHSPPGSDSEGVDEFVSGAGRGRLPVPVYGTVGSSPLVGLAAWGRLPPCSSATSLVRHVQLSEPHLRTSAQLLCADVLIGGLCHGLHNRTIEQIVDGVGGACDLLVWSHAIRSFSLHPDGCMSKPEEAAFSSKTTPDELCSSRTCSTHAPIGA